MFRGANTGLDDKDTSAPANLIRKCDEMKLGWDETNDSGRNANVNERANPIEPTRSFTVRSVR